jgi:hypothetical protein
MTGRFAEQFGLRLSHEQPLPDRLEFTLSAPEAQTAAEPETPPQSAAG